MDNAKRSPSRLIPHSAPHWISDPDTLRSAADAFLGYFENSPDPVLGMHSGGLGDFYIVHRFAGDTFLSSAREYKAPGQGGELGDVVTFPDAVNLGDGQRSTLRARVLRKLDAPPSEFARYLVFAFNYTILVE